MAEGAPRAPRGRSQGAGTLRKKFPELIAAIAGRVGRRWFERGMRPRGVRDLRHEATYLFSAVCPERDAGVALVLPTVSAAAMQAMLDELSQAVAADAHAVVLMDRAGWHTARELDLPGNLTPVFLLSMPNELSSEVPK